MKKLSILAMITLGIFLFSIPSVLFAEHTRKTVEAEDTFTDPVYIKAGGRANISIRPLVSSVMTIYCYRQFTEAEDANVSRYVDHWNISADENEKGIEIITDKDERENVRYTLGCPSGNYTSGRVELRLGTEDWPLQ